jgi:hypothetical protein
MTNITHLSTQIYNTVIKTASSFFQKQKSLLNVTSLLAGFIEVGECKNETYVLISFKKLLSSSRVWILIFFTIMGFIHKKIVEEEKSLAKISIEYCYSPFIYYVIGNHLDITSSELDSIKLDHRTDESKTVFYQMLRKGHITHGTDIFDKIYDGFVCLHMESNYKRFLTTINMSERLPSVQQVN